jgi:hypothetical protein
MQSIKLRKVFFIFLSLSIFKLFVIALDDTPRRAPLQYARTRRDRVSSNGKISSRKTRQPLSTVVNRCLARLSDLRGRAARRF